MQGTRQNVLTLSDQCDIENTENKAFYVYANRNTYS